ncbi:MAG: hypothetical protein ACI8X5_002830 [Planctomycetota bacterium]|jgi:hypothetical protein
MIISRTLLPLLLLCPLTAEAGEITWQKDLRAAQAEAKTSKSVVFIAVNMDGERANDRLAQEVYKDKTLLLLAERTINLIASNDTHASADKICPRFGTLTCENHRHVDADVRAEVLAPAKGGFVVAPQHVFLGPGGEVLLSVPYEVKAEELEWCFVSALRSVNPDIDLELSSEARPPRRLLIGKVHSFDAKVAELPLTREGALELVKELKKGMLRGNDLKRGLRRLAMADEPEARDYILSVLRTTPGRAGGGGGRGGGGRGGSKEDKRPEFLHWIGVNSPVSYWEVCIEFIDDSDAPLRAQGIVAVEQLGAKESLKPLLARLRKEKDEAYTKNLLRAIGTCGANDKNARKALLKQGESSRSPLLRVNAILALGWLSSHEETQEFLRVCLEHEALDVQRAALLAIAISRDVAWVEELQEHIEKMQPGAPKNTAELALTVLKSGDLWELKETLKEVASDELKRERIFGAEEKQR